MRFLHIILSFSITLGVFAQKQTPKEYIEKYKDLAVIEMHRSGVPASITLSQGVLESNSGNSRLAKFANNHFGIKCKGSWTGNVIYADDDAPDECFRAYESVLASYQDHSDFLRKNWRYHPLFELKPKDYKGWCHGLRKAGYATNPQYGKILISLIDRYDLHQYDKVDLPKPGLPELVVGESVNGVPVKTAKEGETVASIASENYVKDRHIRKWNDLHDDAEIKTGEIVYLKPKRRRGSEEKHIVTEGEDMREISQTYGIKLKQLYKKNRMEKGTEPKEGEVIYMQKKRSSDDAIKLAEKEPQWEEKKEEIFINPHSVPQSVVDSTDFSNPGALNKVEVEVPEYHVVAKGDNIYRIAEKYHVFEEDLLKWNKNLNPSAMSIGQKIYLSNKANSFDNEVIKKTTPAPKVKAPETEKEIEKIKNDITVNGPISHLVVKGDTLYNICKRYNVTVDQLKKWNKLSDINIQLGQKLQVSE
ncbi:LysM peptidoglycan-binding domain-containing protein [Bacteroidia bacterium]|nr:LysM peptidoglycan-binding domain-containing protein [Bacteroidia bacterium]